MVKNRERKESSSWPFHKKLVTLLLGNGADKSKGSLSLSSWRQAGVASPRHCLKVLYARRIPLIEADVQLHKMN